MEIKAKLYPYPVLATFSDDYKQGTFDTTIGIVQDGYNLKIDFQSTLTSSGLKDLIENGCAKYVYHLECPQTGFRTVEQTEKQVISRTLSNKVVNGKLQICPFIVATLDLTNYSNDDFHDDYAGTTFDIEAGCVLAVGRMVTVDISKDIDDLANTPSVFCIVRNADSSCRQMLVDYSGRKIVIKLPMDDYYSYKQLSRNPVSQPILNALTIIPALTYVLEEMKSLSISERTENTESLWYKTLSNVLLSKFDCNIESEDFELKNCLELAQKLINDPIADAFKMLTNSFGTYEGEDE